MPTIFRHLRSRLSSSSSPGTVESTGRPSVDNCVVYPTDGDFASDLKTPNSAQPTKEIIPARLEPVFSSTSQEPSYYWQNIDPPPPSYQFQRRRASYHHRRRSSRSSMWRPMMYPNPISTNSALPGYNTVSGAVVVDWNGLPYFLSPQEEEERKSKLERAVQERMLGLSKETDFGWSRPCHGATLPRYSSIKEVASPRESSYSE
ncbi:hypothetical protein BDV28DRAFT_130568 [Aspergillus coremiiformis]|uniref:Uncharacterized protein n=1 Tax=Aspergillus coremiiformis TaxID=138285 RepID=A0A5N6ZCQ2_9EURO|nr:hypothetical protein BDV28DRAFT_130568 [Aspergillus coremiiformis]